jgi:hypothetical protein
MSVGSGRDDLPLLYRGQTAGSPPLRLQPDHLGMVVRAAPMQASVCAGTMRCLPARVGAVLQQFSTCLHELAKRAALPPFRPAFLVSPGSREQRRKRAGRPCGHFSQVQGPRQVRTYALWAGEEDRILLNDGTGQYFAETRLSAAPDPRRLAA